LSIEMFKKCIDERNLLGAAISLEGLENIDMWYRALHSDDTRVYFSNLTPLGYAVYMGYVDGITMLLAKGAQIDAVSFEGSPAIHYATTKATFDCLLENGADIESLGKEDNTPLLTYIERKDIHIANHILSKGADPTISNKRGSTALHLAAMCQSNVESLLVSCLNAGAELNAQNSNGNTPMHLFVRNGALPSTALEIFISSGADLDVQNTMGYTALHIAVRYRLWDAMQILLDAGANTNLTSKWGLTAYQMLEEHYPEQRELFNAHRIN